MRIEYYYDKHRDRLEITVYNPSTLDYDECVETHEVGLDFYNQLLVSVSLTKSPL